MLHVDGGVGRRCQGGACEACVTHVYRRSAPRVITWSGQAWVRPLNFEPSAMSRHFKMYLLTSGYAEDLKNTPMEVWEGGEGGGRVQSRETLRVLWVGPQMCAIFVERTYTEGSNLQSLCS